MRTWINYEKVFQKVWDGMSARIDLTQLQNRGLQYGVLNSPATYVLAHLVEDTLEW